MLLQTSPEQGTGPGQEPCGQCHRAQVQHPAILVLKGGGHLVAEFRIHLLFDHGGDGEFDNLGRKRRIILLLFLDKKKIYMSIQIHRVNCHGELAEEGEQRVNGDSSFHPLPFSFYQPVMALPQFSHIVVVVGSSCSHTFLHRQNCGQIYGQADHQEGDSRNHRQEHVAPTPDARPTLEMRKCCLIKYFNGFLAL